MPQKRTTHRSTAGKSSTPFEMKRETYTRAHAQDIKQKARGEK